MVTSTTLDLFPVELDQRTNDGVDVSLLWSKRTNTVTVAVSDAKSGASFQFAVDGAHALDAFHHPYAYAAHNGTWTEATTREPVYA